MSTYSAAVEAIRNYSESYQSNLNRVAVDKLAITVKKLRDLPLEGIVADSPQHPLCFLVSQTLTVGRSDWYPQVSLPEETKKVICAAVNASILVTDKRSLRIGGLIWYADLSGLAVSPTELVEAAAAWQLAKDYREKQTWKGL